MRNTEDVELLKDYISANHEKLFQISGNINSVGIAYKEIKNRKKNRLALRFSVEKKINLTELDKKQIKLIPKSLNLEYEGRSFKVMTDVVERAFPKMVEAKVKVNKRTELFASVRPGISISGLNAGTGTIGLIVKEKNSNIPMILGNWHVMGDRYNEVKQPSFNDDSFQSRKIGNVEKNYIGKEGDCAICNINTPYNTAIFDLDITPKSILPKNEIKFGLKLVKSGRTTGITYGEVNAVGLVIKHNYGNMLPPNLSNVNLDVFEIAPQKIGKTRKFKGRLPIVDSGDSGSAWLIDENDRKKFVTGLHFYHDVKNSIQYAYACFIEDVFQVLNIELYP